MFTMVVGRVVFRCHSVRKGMVRLMLPKTCEDPHDGNNYVLRTTSKYCTGICNVLCFQTGGSFSTRLCPYHKASNTTQENSWDELCRVLIQTLVNKT